MAYLSEQRYTPITVTQLVQAMTDRTAHLPGRPVVLTFDDGFADFYTAALSILKSHNFVATLFVTTGFIGHTSHWLSRAGEGERSMLNWEQVAEISDSGIECGAHSHSHPHLDILSPAAAWDEITRCKTELEQHLGRRAATFAYPHGYYSPTVRRLVQQAGYSSACAVKHAMSGITDDPFALARIIVAADTDVEGLGKLLTDRELPIAPLRERVRTRAWRLVRRLSKPLM
jgi:peptidoglycan/xylan/chitin deacetylase (PgdA/CDA1 family)